LVFLYVTYSVWGWNIVVIIATCYVLDGPWDEFRGLQLFRALPEEPWDPRSLLYNGNRVSYPGVNGRDMEIRTYSHLKLKLKKE
jgi:hypothetical protein